MTKADVSILKIGGSVLPSLSHVQLAVSEIYRHIRRGGKVIAVVSALKGETDRLLRLAREFGGEKSAHLPLLLATGETSSASILAIALEQAGLKAAVKLPQDLALKAVGSAFDAELASVDIAAVQDALEGNDVVIVPGFYAVSEQGGLCLLGRGGTDLTAVFLGASLPHAHVSLLKDVDGVYESDPNKALTQPRRYASVSWDDVRLRAAPLVQPKTAEFAKSHNRVFDVAAFSEDFSTLVGPQTHLAEAVQKRCPLRIAIIGHGVVGGGLAARLELEPQKYEIASILVRDLAKHKAAFPLRPFTASNDDFLSADADVLIDCGSTAEHSAGHLKAFLSRGIACITANKQALAGARRELLKASLENHAPLYASASVGGGVPCFELVAKAKAQGVPKAIEAILNGTTNFILTELERGKSFTEALALAQEKGLAEADPSADIDGFDAAAKIFLLASEAFDGPLKLADVQRESWKDAEKRIAEGGLYKQVARATFEKSAVILKVSFEKIQPGDWLARASGEQNCIRVLNHDGSVFEASGKGAGRVPTVLSVLADLIDARNAIFLNQTAPARHLQNLAGNAEVYGLAQAAAL